MKIVYKPPPEHYEEATSYEWELAALDEYFQPKAEFKVLYIFSLTIFQLFRKI